MLRASLPFLTVALLAIPSIAQAATIDVDTTNDAIDGNNDCSLREAIIAANSNTAVDGCTAGDAGADTINVPAGTYTLGVTGLDEDWQVAGGGGDPFELNVNNDAAIGDLDIFEDVTVAGAGADVTIIEWMSPGSDRIFHVVAGAEDVAATFSGMTLQNGVTASEIVNPQAPQVDQWRFSRHGGAIAVGVGVSLQLDSQSGNPGDTGHPEEEDPVGAASLTITDCVLDTNTAAGDGGGLYAAGEVTATNVVFSNNSSGANGGGIYNDAASTYTSCYITTNSGENGGGMFYTGNNTTTLDGCTIAENTAVGGAGVASRTGVTLDFTNATISGNAATDVGGGVLSNGPVNLVNSTVIGNSSTSDAGFAAGGLVTFGSGVMDSSNTLVAANTVGENNTVVNCGCTGGGCMTANGFDSSGFNLEDADTCNFADTSDLVDTDPMTTALGDYGGPVPTHGLLAGSPALDAASNDNCTATDARTLDRPSDGNADGTADCDIGAFELSSDEYDADGDGYCIGIDWGDGDTCVDGTTPGDCDDGEATAFPGNPETCDGIDNDCNDMIDDGLPTSDYYPDVDGDGFGDPNEDVIAACAMPADASDNNEDCDDTDAAVNPDATEVCDNGIDDNCNGMIDEDCDGDTDGGTGTASATAGMTSAGDTEGDTDTAGEDTGDEGCSCQTTPTTPGLGALMLGLLGLFARRRRRS